MCIHCSCFSFQFWFLSFFFSEYFSSGCHIFYAGDGLMTGEPVVRSVPPEQFLAPGLFTSEPMDAERHCNSKWFNLQFYGLNVGLLLTHLRSFSAFLKHAAVVTVTVAKVAQRPKSDPLSSGVQFKPAGLRLCQWNLVCHVD